MMILKSDDWSLDWQHTDEGKIAESVWWGKRRIVLSHVFIVLVVIPIDDNNIFTKLNAEISEFNNIAKIKSYRLRNT